MRPEEIYEHLGRAYFSAEPHERDLLRCLPRLVGGMRTFVDIGASLGQYTLAAARALAPLGRVTAVEADPVRFEELERNCARWQSETGCSVRAVHAAVAEHEGTVDFFVTGSPVSGGLFAHDVAADVEWTPVRVPCVTLDALCAGDPPDYVKIDVEGAEMRVLRGARGLLGAGRTSFQVELHGWGARGGGGPRQVVAFMMRRAYAPLPLYGHWIFTRRPRVAARALAGRWG